MTDPANGPDSLGLMILARQVAGQDAGDVLAKLDSLAIVGKFSFPGPGNLCAALAEASGAIPNNQSEAPHGAKPSRLLNEAANRIAVGEITLAEVVGGEALRTAAGSAAKMAGRGILTLSRKPLRSYRIPLLGLTPLL